MNEGEIGVERSVKPRIDQLQMALLEAWSIHSSSKWTAQNPAKGQCGVTALIVNDLLGGEILKTKLPEGWHFYNKINGTRFDFTESQFQESIDYLDIPSSRDEAFLDTNTEQYHVLKQRTQRILKGYYYPILETERMYLKLLTLQHTEEVFTHFQDDEVTRFMDIEPCKDLSEAEEIIQYHLEDAGCRWGLFDQTTQHLIGTCGFHYLRKSDTSFTAEIGFDLSKLHWGKGYMYEALQAVIHFGFSTMNLDVMDATVEPANTRSIRLLQRLGFEKEAELRDDLLYFYKRKSD